MGSAPPLSGTTPPPRRVGVVAGTVSVVFHLVLILMYAGSGVQFIPAVTLDTSELDEVDEFRGTQIINIEEIEDPEAAPVITPAPPIEESTPVPVPVEETPEPAPTEEPTDDPGEVTDAPVADAEDPRTAAEILRIDATDTEDRNLEFWKPVDPSLVAMSDTDFMLLLLAMDLERWNDSIATLVEAQRDASDWTFIDDEGRRWGIADGQLHLGSITLPLPFSFGSNPWMRDEAAQRRFEDEAIRRGIERQATLRTLEQRARIMRERIDRERNQRRRGGRPDTSSVRR